MPSERSIVIQRAWQVAQGSDHLGPGFQHQPLSRSRRRITRGLTQGGQAFRQLCVQDFGQGRVDAVTHHFNQPKPGQPNQPRQLIRRQRSTQRFQQGLTPLGGKPSHIK